MKSLCIDIDTLDKYINGLLSAQDKEQTEKHFLICDKCLEQFVLAREMVSDPELINYKPHFTNITEIALQAIREKADAFKEKIKKLSEWLPDLSIPEWAGVPVRSGDVVPRGSVFVRKNMDDLQAEVFVRKTEDNKARIFIKVFKGRTGAKNISLKFGKQGKRPGEILLCREKDFFDKKISFGAYHLTLEQERKEKGCYLFTIEAEGIYER